MIVITLVSYQNIQFTNYSTIIKIEHYCESYRHIKNNLCCDYFLMNNNLIFYQLYNKKII